MALMALLALKDRRPKMDGDKKAPATTTDAPATGGDISSQNKLGVTWERYAADLRQRLKPLGALEIERELRIQKRIFDRHSTANPVAEERNRLFEEAYRSVPPAQRRHFLEGAKKAGS